MNDAAPDSVTTIVDDVRTAGEGIVDPKAAKQARQDHAAAADVIARIADIPEGSPDAVRLRRELGMLGISAGALRASLKWHRDQLKAARRAHDNQGTRSAGIDGDGTERSAGDVSSTQAASDDGLDWTDRLVTRWTKNGRVADDVAANAIVALRFHPAWQGVVAFDEFRQSIVTVKPPPWGPEEAPPTIKLGPWTDGDSVRLQAWLRREAAMPMKLGRDAVDAALIVASEAKPVDPPREYLESIEWDAHFRVGAQPSELAPEGQVSWLTRYLGVPDSPYTRWVGRWFLIASVARIFSPGCKVDNAIVLEGAQGAMKSTAARVLYHPWYSDTPIDLSNKDRFSSIQGVWGYELAEFDAYNRHEAAVVKAFASSPLDKYRPPYLRRDVTVPRRCVFLATINPGKEYLQDETGGRRWWPVRVGTIDIEGLKRDRDVLWAEARDLYLSGEPHYPKSATEHAACRSEQAERLSRDAWEDPICDWLACQIPTFDITVGAVLGGPIGLDKSKWGRAEQMRAAAVLRGAGYERVRARDGSRREYVFRKAALPAAAAGTAPPP